MNGALQPRPCPQARRRCRKAAVTDVMVKVKHQSLFCFDLKGDKLADAGGSNLLERLTASALNAFSTLANDAGVR